MPINVEHLPTSAYVNAGYAAGRSQRNAKLQDDAREQQQQLERMQFERQAALEATAIRNNQLMLQQQREAQIQSQQIQQRAQLGGTRGQGRGGAGANPLIAPPPQQQMGPQEPEEMDLNDLGKRKLAQYAAYEEQINSNLRMSDAQKTQAILQNRTAKYSTNWDTFRNPPSRFQPGQDLGDTWTENGVTFTRDHSGDVKALVQPKEAAAQKLDVPDFGKIFADIKKTMTTKTIDVNTGLDIEQEPSHEDAMRKAVDVAHAQLNMRQMLEGKPPIPRALVEQYIGASVPQGDPNLPPPPPAPPTGLQPGMNPLPQPQPGTPDEMEMERAYAEYANSPEARGLELANSMGGQVHQQRVGAPTQFFPNGRPVMGGGPVQATNGGMYEQQKGGLKLVPAPVPPKPAKDETAKQEADAQKEKSRRWHEHAKLLQTKDELGKVVAATPEQIRKSLEAEDAYLSGKDTSSEPAKTARQQTNQYAEMLLEGASPATREKFMANLKPEMPQQQPATQSAPSGDPYDQETEQGVAQMERDAAAEGASPEKRRDMAKSFREVRANQKANSQVAEDGKLGGVPFVGTVMNDFKAGKLPNGFMTFRIVDGQPEYLKYNTAKKTFIVVAKE